MSDYLELVFDVFDETGQRASVLKTLRVVDLMDEIVIEFDELDPDAPVAYGLYLEGSDRQLELGQTLLDQGVQPGDRLIFGWARDLFRAQRRPVTTPGQATLQELNSRVMFPIEWQPAIIGRPDADQTHNALLTANLEWLSNSHRVSRQHAQISERDGKYFLESLEANNPTFINRETLEIGKKYALSTGDQIALGHSGITLGFDLREDRSDKNE